jgi:hypothetical protein
MATTERGDLMYKLSQLVEEHKETLATIETWDNGIISTSIHNPRSSSTRSYWLVTSHVLSSMLTGARKVVEKGNTDHVI